MIFKYCLYSINHLESDLGFVLGKLLLNTNPALFVNFMMPAPPLAYPDVKALNMHLLFPLGFRMLPLFFYQ
jgi:hypothetical protein